MSNMYQNDSLGASVRRKVKPQEPMVYEDRKDPKTSNLRKQSKDTTSQEATKKRREKYLRDGRE